ncbi:MAG TPA: hotdog domain-containing protein [Jiangellaceae bacterium]|nr:hotdog domain-containing protein [Jiangellaceae bacterium]
MTTLAPGLGADVAHLVGEDDTATALGSGDVPVLATPRLLALAEAATVAAVAGALPEGASSVGTRVELEHLAASPVGVRVSVRAELVGVDGRLLQFEVVAEHPDGRVVAHGRVSRVVVDRARFLQRSRVPGG